MTTTYSSTSNSLRVVLVTGCTRGMGKKLFEFFSTDSRIKLVIGVSRPSDKLNRMEKQFSNNAKCKIYGLDVTDYLAIEELANRLKSQNIIPDLLINNAAILGPVKPLYQVTPHEFDLTIKTNLNGAFYFMKYFIPLMKERQIITTTETRTNACTVVNMSSGWGRNIEKHFGAYCTSKYALEGLSQAFAEDTKDTNICVVAIAPGVVETDMLYEANTGTKGVPLETWIKSFPDMILNINKKESGKQLTWSQRE